MKTPTVVLSLFGLFWTAIVLLFDGALVQSVYLEGKSLGFREVPGKVLASKMEVDHGGDSTSYQAKVTYEYNFRGELHESSRLTASKINSSSQAEARELVRQFAPGKNCRVFVNPEKPADAVLIKGFTGKAWFMGLFLTPFNVAMVGIWYAVVVTRRPARAVGGAEVKVEGKRLLLRWATLPAPALGVIAFGGVSFAGIFATGIFQGNQSGPILPLTVWALAAVAGVLTWKHLRHRTALTHPDLVIDTQAGTLTLTKGVTLKQGNWSEYRAWKKSGRPPRILPLETIRAVGTAERVVTDSDGDTKTQVAVLQLVSDDGKNSEQDLGTWASAEESGLFAAWLRETLGVPDIVRKPVPAESENGSWDNPSWRN